MMKTPFGWVCPFCDRAATITENNVHTNLDFIGGGNKYGDLTLKFDAIICPNEACKEISLTGELHQIKHQEKQMLIPLYQWRLIPQSMSRQFPSYIPQQLRNDYQEACSILHLSPKASATLSRRCLQGMIRDFWGITNKRNLKEEIEAIQEKVEPLVWEAIDAIRKIGNIGAHMEKDVDLIINVEPGEAEKLIELIEMLFAEWYVNRHDREQRLKHIKEIAESKQTQKLASNS